MSFIASSEILRVLLVIKIQAFSSISLIAIKSLERLG